MSMKELVDEYNSMVEEIEQKFPSGSISWARKTQKFSDRQSGIQRCQKLESSINAFKKGQKESNDEEKAVSKAPKEKAVSKAPKEQFLSDWGLREGTNVARLVKKLLDNLEKDLKMNDIVKFIYGDVEANGINNVINNVKHHIKKNSLPFILTSNKQSIRLDRE